jgi:chlorophyll synthase
MRAFVMDPIQQAIKLSAFGVPLFVSAMMVSAWALRAMQGEAA